MFYEHYLKEYFAQYIDIYKPTAILVPGLPSIDGEEDGLYTLFLSVDAPGIEFGIDTEETIQQEWELVNYIDEAQLSDDVLALDLTSGVLKKPDELKFGFRWAGEFKTDTFLTIDLEIFVRFLNYLLEVYPDNAKFNLEILYKTRVINQIIE